VSASAALVETAREPARGFLIAARRNLTEQDLDTPAARRFLIAEIERLDQICSEHGELTTRFHNQRVQIAELLADGKAQRKTDFLSNVCLAAGFTGMGAAPAYLTLAGGVVYGVVILLGSACLAAASIISKVRK